MLTQQDIILLKKHFATKDDLSLFATKDDLKRFATKDDLNKYPAKEDLTHVVEEIIEYINSSNEATRIQTVREIRQAIREELSPILQNHEVRIRKLEKDHAQN